jgi:hypothetical protein
MYTHRAYGKIPPGNLEKAPGYLAVPTCIGYPSIKQCFYGAGDNSSGEIRGYRS